MRFSSLSVASLLFLLAPSTRADDNVWVVKGYHIMKSDISYAAFPTRTLAVEYRNSCISKYENWRFKPPEEKSKEDVEAYLKSWSSTLVRAQAKITSDRKKIAERRDNLDNEYTTKKNVITKD